MITAKLDRLAAAYATAKKQVEIERLAVNEAEQRIEDTLQAQQLVQTIAEQVQNKAHAQIAHVVTRCLQTVFGDGTYTFKIDFKKTRGRTEARLLFIKDGEEYSYEEVGGGTVDVAALAMRIAIILLARPSRRRLLVLDEPMKHLNGDAYQERVAELLLILAEEMELQIILSTDDDWLRIGKVIELEQLTKKELSA